MRRLLQISIALAGASAAMAQSDGDVGLEPPRFATHRSGIRHRAVEIRDSRHTCLVVGVRFGFEHDPVGQAGLAQVAADALRIYFEDPARAELGVQVRTLGRGTFVTATVANDRVDQLFGVLAPVLAGRSELPDDHVARAVGRAKLRADDATQVLPGPILLWRARNAMLPDDPRGHCGAGLPEQMAAVDHGALREVFERSFVPSNAFVVALGGLDAAGLERGLESLCGEPPFASGAGPLPFAVHAVVEQPADTKHGLVDAPFVTAAIRAPRWGDEDFLPFLIAVGVLQRRAAVMFQPYRGGEAQAQFPFVAFDSNDEPGVVLFNRRGRDGDSLERVKSEIEGLFADARVQGATRGEAVQAASRIVNALQLPPYSELIVTHAATKPRMLFPRAYVLAIYELFGWPTDLPRLLTKTPVTHVSRVLREAVQPERIRWFALLPDPDRMPTRPDPLRRR